MWREIPSIAAFIFGSARGRPRCKIVVQRVHDFESLLQLGINASPERFWRILHGQIGLHSFALNAVSMPGIPAGDRHSQDVSPRQFEIVSSEKLTCCSRY